VSLLLLLPPILPLLPLLLLIFLSLFLELPLTIILSQSDVALSQLLALTVALVLLSAMHF